MFRVLKVPKRCMSTKFSIENSIATLELCQPKRANVLGSAVLII